VRVQLLAQQNEEQFQVIYAVRDRLAVLEEELLKLKEGHGGWFRSASRSLQRDAQPGAADPPPGLC
jgi:hypothetical protein